MQTKKCTIIIMFVTECLPLRSKLYVEFSKAKLFWLAGVGVYVK